jgi:arylsulfatase A-like enzyme
MDAKKSILMLFSIVIILYLVSIIWLDAGNLGTGIESVLKPLSGAEKPPIVFIVMENTRSDHIGPCYDYSRNTAPNICDVAEDGVLFKNTYSVGTWTIVSLPSMIRSKWPMTGALPYFNYSANAGPLYENLSESGYKLVKDQCADRWWLDIPMERRYIKNITENSFYTSFIGKQAHSPLIPASQFRKWDNVSPSSFEKLRRFREADPKYDELKSNNYTECYTYGDKIPQELVGAAKNTSYNSSGFYEQLGTKNLIALYDEEILQGDKRIGRKIEELKKKEMYKDSLVIITSDHGTGLREHGERFHSGKPYEEQIKVPLIIKLPGNKFADTRIESSVRLIDIPPTIMDIAGYETPKEFQGKSLLPVIYGETYSNGYLEKERPILAAGNIKQRYSYREENYKIMVENPLPFCKRESTDVKLFNLENDPEEKNDLSQNKPSEVEKLRESFCPLFIEEIESPRIDQKDRNLETEQKERLRALGYLK